MAQIFPFRGLRYNNKKVKNIHKIFAPPYDVISPEEQKKLYAEHPYNVVRLILGKVLDSDNKKNNRYTRAADLLHRWIKDEILIFDKTPGIYIYTQDYTIDGLHKRRIGFISRLKFDDKKESCLPHEHTLAKPKEDRLHLMRAVHANLSPIFSFYLDAKKTIESRLKPYLKRKPLVDFRDQEKIRHRFWKLTDTAAIKKIRQMMKTKQIFIADGHHRYEVSLAFKNEMCARKNKSGEEFNYVMMYFTGFSEENLSVLSTHRLVKDVPNLAEKVKALEKYFAISKVDTMEALFFKQKKASGFSVGMYYKGSYYLLKMKDRLLLERLMRKSPAQWRKLDVAMLNKVVFEHIFGLNDSEKEEKIGYTRDPHFAVACVKKRYCEIVFFPNPTKPQQVKKIALSHHRMPQKSTYFYPKPITGLVINKF